MADVRKIGSVGAVDRGIRFLLGFVLLGFALFCPFAHSLGPVVTWGSGLVGAVLLGTATMKFCPLYRIMGIRS